MKKLKSKQVLLLFIILAIFGMSNKNIIASMPSEEESSYVNRNYSCLHWDFYGTGMHLSDIPPIGSNTNVPKGSDMVLHMYFWNAVNTSIRLEGLEGLDFLPYEEGVLRIYRYLENNLVIYDATKEEYEAFLSNGLDADMQGTTKMLFTLKAKTNSSSPTLIKTKITESYEDGRKIERIQDFPGNYEYFHRVNVYDGNEVINFVEYNEMKPLNLPVLEKEGYDFLGYNYQKDGNGKYYNNEAVYESFDLYAIYRKKTFEVNYYVDGKVYEKRQVEYGGNVEILQVISDDSRVFKGWNGNLINVTSNRDVHAIFENNIITPVVEKKDSEIKIKKTSSIDGVVKTNKDKTKTLYANMNTIENSDKNGGESDSLKVVKTVDNQGLNKIIPFIISGIGIIIFIGIKRRSKVKK